VAAGAPGPLSLNAWGGGSDGGLRRDLRERDSVREKRERRGKEGKTRDRGE
jgi:hypothetical protein